MALQFEPLSAIATLLSPYLHDAIAGYLSKAGSTRAKVDVLLWRVAKAEQKLDEVVEFEHLLNSSALELIRGLKCATYQAEDELDEILIGQSRKDQPTESAYNKVSGSFTSFDSKIEEILKSMNEVTPPSTSSDSGYSILSSKSHADIEKFRGLWPQYRQLPPPLKKCFVLLSIFPRNHIFVKENLVQIWMAEDFIRDNGEKIKLEDMGSSYFDKLVERSFFLNSDDHRTYQIVGNLHELAEFVSCGECLTINEDQSIADFKNRLVDSLRHFSLHCENYLSETPNLLAKCDGLRTFFLHIGGMGSIPEVQLPYDQLINFKRLRVLDLSCPSIVLVPDSIGCLKHLRYLDLSMSKIKNLPKTIRKLHSLQMLKLNGCHNLRKLPCLEELRSLKKLFLDKNHNLESSPPGIGQLTNLETFSCPFVVGKENGGNIGVLKKMNSLRGSLCISKLENVLNSEEAKEAALNDKQFLSQLKLKWSEDPTGQCRYEQEQVLQGLQPHRNLETLKILGYGGRSFPHEVTNNSFVKLKKVSLKNCRSCVCLPALWRLPMLKTLSVSGMDGIKELNDNSFLGNGNVFPSLEKLKIKDMRNLTSWVTEQEGDLFPKLNQLMFKDCPMLEKLEVLQILKSEFLLKIEECSQLIQWMEQPPQQRIWQKEEQQGASFYHRMPSATHAQTSAPIPASTSAHSGNATASLGTIDSGPVSPPTLTPVVTIASAAPEVESHYTQRFPPVNVSLPAVPGWTYWALGKEMPIPQTAAVYGVPCGHDYVPAHRYEDLVKMVANLKELISRLTEENAQLRSHTKGSQEEGQ